VWEGTGVSNNKFNPAGLLNGTYKLTYRITTPTGCTISLKDSITIKAVQPLVIKETAGDFCETGAANLKAAPADNTLAYTWYYKELASESLLPINSALSDDVTVYKQGYYQASATNGKCSNVSNIIEVGFNKGLPYVLKPDENHSYNVCNADDFKVTVQAREGTIYTWESKTSDSDIYQVMTGETSHQLVIKKSGMFRVRGEYGFCMFESMPISVEFIHDEIFVPNVFTPNGDDANPVFKVETTLPISRFVILNRFGKEIHSSTDGLWTGGDAPPGVYFWYLTYLGCDQQKELKGWVQLIR
jgi:gliding motility-associated-like protein